jgi:hypothetical protein
MTSLDLDLEKLSPLDRAIIVNLNPFDPIGLKSGNFWLDTQHITTVKSIHQAEIDQIQNILNHIKQDHVTRTILLTGDSGNGKSYLLKRLRDQFNDQAFFTYIEPCPSNDFIWRHTLRKTVESLMAKPAEQEESQLILWLESSSTFKQKGFWETFFGQVGHKKDFVNKMKKSYPGGIYQPNFFFSVLYELVNPHADNYDLACQWLRGDELDEEDIKVLGVNKLINNEVAAQGILENFGRISDATKPIVLCFDQVELAPKLPDGTYDLSGIFQVNTHFHNSYLTNFLIVISILNDFWKKYKMKMNESDHSRIEKNIELKQISLEQVKALWASRLAFIHEKLETKSTSPIAPLDQQWAILETNYPGGKAIIRNSLQLGYKLYEEYRGKIKDESESGDEDNLLTPFKLIWAEELKKTKENVKKIMQFSEPELVDMIAQSLEVFPVQNPVQNIKRHFLTGANGNRSLGFQHQGKYWGVLWSEGAANGFTTAMKVCKTALDKQHCQAMVLIREKSLAKSGQGVKLYQQIFKDNPPNYHLIPTIEDIHYLRTYQKIANDTRSGDLVVRDKTINLAILHELIGKSEVLGKCSLLRRLLLGSESKPEKPEDGLVDDSDRKIKEFLVNLVIENKLIGKQALIDHVGEHFSDCDESKVKSIVDECCQDETIPIELLNPESKLNDQIICYIPS